MDELSETELRYYNDLFKICSESSDGSGKVPALKATSLFRSANLSNEVINKVGASAFFYMLEELRNVDSKIGFFIAL